MSGRRTPGVPVVTNARSSSGRAIAGLALVVALVLAGAWFLVPPVTSDRASAAAPAAEAAPPVPGAVAPDFTATAVDGAIVSLAALRGEPVWITFGATWCADCRTEFPDVQAAHQASGVTTISLYTGEDAATVNGYAKRLGLSLINVPDPQSQIADRYRVLGVPTHFFIDAEGVIHSVRIGVLTRAQMDAELATLVS